MYVKAPRVISGAVSPIALARLRMTPVMMPGTLMGKTTFFTVRH